MDKQYGSVWKAKEKKDTGMDSLFHEEVASLMARKLPQLPDTREDAKQLKTNLPLEAAVAVFISTCVATVVSGGLSTPCRGFNLCICLILTTCGIAHVIGMAMPSETSRNRARASYLRMRH